MDENALFSKYGLKTQEMIELKALMGDKSDNIPGVKGIGEVSGLNLIKEYKNLETIYENLDNSKPALKNKLIEDKENRLRSEYSFD
jgi:DNA polymerase-1